MAETDRFQLTEDAAQQYERFTVPTVTQPHTEVMFEHVSLHQGERVLDAACGTGIVSRVAVERFGNIASIVGVDLNPHMLGIARVNTPATSIPVEWREGDMCALPFPDASFDVVLCQQGLQYVPDKVMALRDMQRVLVPGGRLAFTVWSAPHRHTAALADALRHHVSSEAATSCLSPFAWGDAETIRKSVEDAGFRLIEMAVIESMTCTPSSGDWIAGYIEYIASHSPFTREMQAARMALQQEVSAALQIYRDGHEFVMPSKAHLVQTRVA